MTIVDHKLCRNVLINLMVKEVILDFTSKKIIPRFLRVISFDEYIQFNGLISPPPFSFFEGLSPLISPHEYSGSHLGQLLLARACDHFLENHLFSLRVFKLRLLGYSQTGAIS